MKELTKQIKEKSFHKVYLLTGDEPYLVLQAKHMLKNAMIKEGDTMNYAAFTDGKIDLNTLQELASFGRNRNLKNRKRRICKYYGKYAGDNLYYYL